MPEHFTKTTTECFAYCKTCRKQTRHRVDGGRCGHCFTCINALEQGIALNGGMSRDQIRRAKKRELQAMQPDLFAGDL